jgi:hypothetical protein
MQGRQMPLMTTRMTVRPHKALTHDCAASVGLQLMHTAKCFFCQGMMAVMEAVTQRRAAQSQQLPAAA